MANLRKEQNDGHPSEGHRHSCFDPNASNSSSHPPVIRRHPGSQDDPNGSLTSGSFYPLPPGAVPVGTLSRPSSPTQHALPETSNGNKEYEDVDTMSRHRGPIRKLSNKRKIANLRKNRGRTSDGGEVKSGMIVCYVDGPPPPLAFLPPPSTWPLFSAVPALCSPLSLRPPFNPPEGSVPVR